MQKQSQRKAGSKEDEQTVFRQKQLLMESPRGEQSPHHLGPRRRRKKLSAVGYEKEGVRWRGLWLEW